MTDPNLQKLFSITGGVPASLLVAKGFCITLNKFLDDVVKKIDKPDYKGSKLWELFKDNGGKSLKPKLPSSMSYHGDGSDTPIEMQKDSLQKTWHAIV